MLKRTLFSFVAIALMASSPALAADAQRPVKDCTPQSGPLEVLFGKCHLVKGVALYGQGLENLSGIAGGMSPSAGGTAAGSM